MNLIQTIRRGHGFDSDMRPRVAGDPVAILQGKLGRACERPLVAISLSNELYQVKTHYLLELIQNADDNKYADVVPTLKMRIEDRLIRVECNEAGFTPDNVKAICDIGVSTKTGVQGFIGEKGIGFKSVFTIADVVYISSGRYTFKFDRREKLGMITPVWDTTYSVRRGWTTFHLQLSESEDGALLSHQIGNIKPSLLLFLRRLRSLQIDVAVSNRSHNKQIRFEHNDTDEHISRLKRFEDDQCVLDDNYFVFKHTAGTFTREPRRENIKQTEIVLAFPVTGNEAPEIRKNEEVHAFLPLGCFGFTFIIQADFLTSSSREGILSDLPWNTTLCRNIVDAFVGAVEHFQKRSALRDTWFRFLPTGITNPFFHVIEEAIISRLKSCHIFRSTDGAYRCPSKVLTVPPRFCCDAQPMIPEEYLPPGLYYLSSVYIKQDYHHFVRLGVSDISDADFLFGLLAMDASDKIRGQPETWHDAVCSYLKSSWRRHHNAKVLDLRILPLGDGSWAAAKFAGNYVFELESGSVPDGLGLQTIAAGIKRWGPRYSLFELFGVKFADPGLIAEKILTSPDIKSVSSFIGHARFLFDHRYLFKSLNLKGFRLVDEDGEMGYGNELYLDLPDTGLRSVLPSYARFLHADYVLSYKGDNAWLFWLRDGLGVNVGPRLINGELSPEFKEMTLVLKSPKLLEALKEYWPLWRKDTSGGWIRQLSDTKVTCVDGTVQQFCATFLKTRSLSHYPELPFLPFLPVVNPDDPSWNFLSQLGVATYPNVIFWIKLLVRLREVEHPEAEVLVAQIYRQLHARFHEDRGYIQSTFRERPLIYLSPDGGKTYRWFGITDVFWDGPPSMASKVAIKNSYPLLQDFFRLKLGIPNAPSEILFEELTLLANEWKSRTIPEDIQNRVTSMLVDLSDAVSEPLTDHTTQALRSLGGLPIFPVRCPKLGLRLCTVNDFYVPDKNGQYAKLLHGQVALLAIPSAIILRLQPVLDTIIFKSRIRYLETSISRRLVAQGQRVLDTAATANFAIKVEYIKRVVHATKGSKPTSMQLDFLGKMRDMRIFSVDSIESTLNLADKSIAAYEDLMIEVTPDGLNVLISKTCAPPRRNLVICKEVGHLLEVDTIKLLSLVAQPEKTLKELFELEGIPNVARDTHDTPNWTRSAVRNLSNAEPRRQHSAESPSNAGGVQGHVGDAQSLGGDVQSHASDIQSHASDIQSHAGANGIVQPGPAFDAGLQEEIARAKQISLTSGFFPTPDQIHFASSGNFTAKSAEALSQISSANFTPQDVKGVSDLALPSTDLDLCAAVEDHLELSSELYSQAGSGAGPGTSNASKYQRVSGVLGEHYVYRLLCSDPELKFGPENWTSESRCLVDGLPPYEGQSLADFKYEDRGGVLTGRLYGEQTKKEWEGRWPIYHLEVKTTSGAAREPFHMSRRQLDIALNLTSRSDAVPTDVYAIFRVSGVRTPTQRLSVYLDPHRKFYDGGLRVISDHVEILLAE